MIQRDIHDMLRKEYDWAMTKLKRVFCLLLIDKYMADNQMTASRD